MPKASGPRPGEVSIAEIQEFAAFSAGTQRYIRRALDIGLRRHDATTRWSRSVMEETSIRAQIRIYERLDLVRANLPNENGLAVLENFLGPLIAVTAYDLAQTRIDSYKSYRFLYERLLGAPARPWLPSAYCAAASLPNLAPDRRKLLLASAHEGEALATSWSADEPSFYPQWVDKVDETRSAT